MTVINKYLPYVLIAVLITAGWKLIDSFMPQPSAVHQTVIATPVPELKGQPTQTIAPRTVKVYTPPAKKKLNLPPDVQDDPNKYVLASSKLPNDTRPRTVTTVIDAVTGEATTYVRRDPLPWIATEQAGEIRLDVGYKYNGMQIAQITRLSLREDLLQVKALHAGVNAAIDSDGSWFVGAGIGWRW